MLTVAQQIILLCFFVLPEDPEGFRKYRQAMAQERFLTANPGYRKLWVENRPGGKSEYQYYRNCAKRYGVSQSELDALREKQKDGCAICLLPLSARPHVDHCHKTKKVRGLLCRFCNTGLGNFRDNPENLLRAKEYLHDNR